MARTGSEGVGSAWHKKLAVRSDGVVVAIVIALSSASLCIILPGDMKAAKVRWLLVGPCILLADITGNTTPPHLLGGVK